MRATMMMTCNQAFEELRCNLELTGLQEATVSTRQQNVRDAVAGKLTVIDDFLTGSYRRHTLIGPLKQADVDIVVVSIVRIGNEVHEQFWNP